MRRLHVRTSKGELVFLVSQEDGPVVLMLSGLARGPKQLTDWPALLPGFALSFAELPGHNGAPPLPKTDLEVWTAAFNEALPFVFPKRELYVVGESLGGLLAMGLNARHIVAVDPFLEAPWFIRDRVQVPEMSKGLQRITLQPQYAVLERIKTPVLILGGTEPAGEPRAYDQMPSALTDADYARFEEHSLITCQRVEGGHLLLSYSQPAVAEIIRRTFRQVPALQVSDSAR